MNEPPTSWDLEEEENSSMHATTTKFSAFNINAAEFVPSFGSKATSVPTPAIPKTPPSTPVAARHTNENETNQVQNFIMNTNRMEEDFPTRRGDDLPDDETERSF